jgi:hypothetical protein
MKAKIERGGGFRGVLNYGLGKGDNACAIIGGNMSGTDPRTLSAEFSLSRAARPGVSRPVWHASLTLPEGERLDPDKWNDIVADFMDGIGLSDHQHVVIGHYDTKLDHVHIIASRIGLDGDLWHGRFDAKRAIALTQELEKKHGLTITKGLDVPSPAKAPTRNEIEMSVRTEDAPPRMVLQQIVDAALEDEPCGIFDFMDRVEAAGAVARPNVATTGKMNGFSFEIDGVPFKGSDLGKSYTWKGLQGRGLLYEQDRDSEELRERARRAISRESLINGGGADTSDPAPGPAGAGFEHDQPEIRRVALGDGADLGSGDIEDAGDIVGRDRDNIESNTRSVSDTDSGAPLPPDVPVPVDVAGSVDIDASLDRISDLAAPDPARDLGDGPVPPLTPAQKAKALSWAKQSEALGAPEYRLTLKSRVEGFVDFNMGKGKGADGAEIFYQPDAVAKMIPYLSRQNLVGYDIYITPIDKKHHYLLIDDSTPEKIDQMRSEGFAPALVQQSSAGNLQAIFKIHRIDQPREQKAANALVVTLNKAYGDPKLSGVIHPFRMAGFANKKPGRNNAFTRVIEAAGVICSHAAGWLADIRNRMKPAPVPLPKKPSKVAKIEPSVSQPADLRFIKIWEREERFAKTKSWNVDLSILDYRVAKGMLSEGFTSSDVAGAMQRKSPDIETRHPNTSAYIRHTVGKAVAEVGRQSRPDVVSTPLPNKDKEDDNEPGL